MTYYVGNMPVGDDELMHYGTKGMRWGQRRFQNRDGSLTAAGRLRYGWGRAKRGAGRAYGQARRTAKRTYKKAGNWYQRNKKTIGRVALGAGIAAAGAVGFRNRKAIARAARVLGGKAFPAGTRRAQFISGMRVNPKFAMRKLGRDTLNIAKSGGRKAVNAAQQFGRGARNRGMAIKGHATSAARLLGAEAPNIRRKARNAGMAAKGHISSGARVIGGTIKRGAKNAPRKIRNASMTVRGHVSSGAKIIGGRAKEATGNVVRRVKNARTRRADVKNVSRAMAENEFARRRMHLRNEAGKDLVKGSRSDIAKLKIRRAANRVGDAYQKTKGKASSARNTVRNTSMSVRGHVRSARNVIRENAKNAADRRWARRDERRVRSMENYLRRRNKRNNRRMKRKGLQGPPAPRW